jgi:hypothetical protein
MLSPEMVHFDFEHFTTSNFMVGMLLQDRVFFFQNNIEQF